MQQRLVPNSKHTLPKSFFERDSDLVARELLGHRLVRILPSGERLVGIIVETEAYRGTEDPSAHSFSGRRTSRVKSMYLGGGHWYVYFIYGNYFCVNVVTGAKDSGHAVLLRALEPVEGIDLMRQFRLQKAKKTSLSDHLISTGPGRLCQAMNIDRSFDGKKAYNSENLFIEKKSNLPLPNQIKIGPRIGLNPKSKSYLWPLRFYLDANPFVSK